ncbi:hypothetical protein GCM10007049_17690 [Echinicola pacifica]|uniref:DUF5060 domain-containing protein n=1 Tax=Echinicola pacifica TaxID=346377 RepID=A0A918UPY3_9BACT|nr:DUF5060 domain-containing protein [Echinicola pacifica]GGZ25619.1 hypothetical protein GCM10007049_17690 [Echinicola pacifica]
MKLRIYVVMIAAMLMSCTKAPEISGELKVWHKVTLTFTGPESSETASPNPFADYRLDVTFSQGEKSFKVPGYFAADGNAAITSASEGDKWRVHFSPDAPGNWEYQVSFKKGKDIAVVDGEGESAGFMDGEKGSFEVAESDKSGADLRAHGRLKYVGEHYLQFSQSGNYFVKFGVDAPENLLAYYELDNTPNVGERLKKWEDHAQDYHEDAKPYLWGADQQKGKNILGAINYLHTKGLNAFSFLTFNVDGDDRNVFPHLLKVDLAEYENFAKEKKNPKVWENQVIHDRFDVSKMDQWEQIFSYGDMKGMFLHFKTQENENDQKMDGGSLGRERKLYYRELIARYSHHLALNWNLGEEDTNTLQEVRDFASYFADNDPYKNIAVVHTFPNDHDKYYQPLVDQKTDVLGFSVQTNKPDFSRVHEVTNKWVKASSASGRKLVVAVDEPGDAVHSLVPDTDNPDHDNARINALWGTLMAGGYGVEWYFGYKHAHSDLTCESWRSRELFWDQGKVAMDFFNNNDLPLIYMENMDEMTAAENDYVFGKTGEIYLVYLKEKGTVQIDLPDVGYRSLWLNPKTGDQINGEGETSIEELEMDSPFEQDALLYLYK